MRTLTLAALLLGSGSVLVQDQALQRPIRVDGRALRLSEALRTVSRETGRVLVLSDSVEDREAFVAAPGNAAAPVLEGLAEVFSTEDEELRWGALGDRAGPRYVLLPVGRTPEAQVRLAQRQVEATLRKGARAPGDPETARLGLFRALPSGTRARVVDQAVRSGRAVLPLGMFDRSLVAAAAGRANVRRRFPDGSSELRYSWQDAAAGRGFLQVRSWRNADGTTHLRMTIGSGKPPAPGEHAPGPSVKLNFADDRERAGGPLPTAPGRSVAPRRPEDRITLLAHQPLRPQEAPLANVLRQLAESSGRPVVCRWPTGDSRVKLRLTADVVEQPLPVALKAIRDRYGLEGEKRDPCLLLRPSPRGRASQ